MIRTRFTNLVKCSVPIQLAPMPGISTGELVAAVASAGGVGMVPATMLAPAVLDKGLDQLKARARGVVGVNFLMPFLDRECVAIAARKAGLVEFFYGEPEAALVAEAGAHGAHVGWQVGSVTEALAAEKAGCHFVVAQGTEAGGHVRGDKSILDLLPSVIDAVGIPVVAAGGIGSARDLAAVLAFGAGAARMGTRFIAASESGAHPTYVRALIAASSEDTCLTEAFSVPWPNAPHRVLRSALSAAQRSRQEIIGSVRRDGQDVPIPRWSVFPPTKDTTGDIQAMALYAGESVVDVHRVESAAAIMALLMQDAETYLSATR